MPVPLMLRLVADTWTHITPSTRDPYLKAAHTLTDLINLAPVCTRHHAQIHNGELVLTRNPSNGALTSKAFHAGYRGKKSDVPSLNATREPPVAEGLQES